MRVSQRDQNQIKHFVAGELMVVFNFRCLDGEISVEQCNVYFSDWTSIP